VHRASPQDRLQPLAELAHALPNNRDQIEPWLLLEIAPKVNGWIDQLESALSSRVNAAALTRLLPPLYEALDIPERKSRLEKLQQRAIQLLIKGKMFAEALPLVESLPEPEPLLEAACHQGLGNFREAAECYRNAGNLKEALQAYRSIPDFVAALALVRELGDHPASESLEWISRMQKLVAERPEQFTKTVTTAEKKLLEELLEQSLGVTRKVAAKKRATKKTAAKKPTTKKNVPSSGDAPATTKRTSLKPRRGGDPPF
jgi:tetratricopeptide (TPR) repeat protein